jgi:3-hydroxybutyryl-CoA dehydratase
LTLALGVTASVTKTITEADLRAFAGVSGDDNPMHLSAEFAKGTRFGKQIAHGMLTAGLISAVLGTKLPGPGAIYLSQSLMFLKPVFIGDTITASATVTSIHESKPMLTLHTRCVNQNGETVLDGEAVMLLDDANAYRKQIA